MNLIDYLPGVPNFPKPGILFRDISPLLANPAAFKEAISRLNELAQSFDYTHILGIESRGFIFGSALALHAHKGLIIARKPNKLPLASHREFYGLEYGTDSLEIAQSTIPKDTLFVLFSYVFRIVFLLGFLNFLGVGFIIYFEGRWCIYPKGKEKCLILSLVSCLVLRC